jgi:hypothetical protein
VEAANEKAHALAVSLGGISVTAPVSMSFVIE